MKDTIKITPESFKCCLLRNYLDITVCSQECQISTGLGYSEYKPHISGLEQIDSNHSRQMILSGY